MQGRERLMLVVVIPEAERMWKVDERGMGKRGCE